MIELVDMWNKGDTEGIEALIKESSYNYDNLFINNTFANICVGGNVQFAKSLNIKRLRGAVYLMIFKLHLMKLIYKPKRVRSSYHESVN